MGTYRKFVRRLLRRERGQMLIIFALLIVPVTFAIGAVVVDASLWQSERRGAQKDADLAALAGALELAQNAPNADDARAEATAFAATNDESGNAGVANLVVDNSCYPQDPRVDAVMIDVTHDSRSLFAGIFGVTSPNIGGHAKACAGAAASVTLGNAVPIQIDDNDPSCFNGNEEPIFTALCGLEYGGQGGNQGSRGVIDLDAPGDFCSNTQGGVNNIDIIIRDGASGTCMINETDACAGGPWYDCVSIQPGNAQKILDGVNMRIELETAGGPCDPDGDGIHDFEDTITLVFDSGDPETSTYEGKDCNTTQDGVQISPRLVTIVVLEEEPNGNPSTPHPIVAFAGFYLVGCADDRLPGITENSPEMERKCDIGNGNGNNGLAQPGGGGNAQPVSFSMAHKCGHQSAPICTPVPTNTPPASAATPTPGNGGGPNNGHGVVYGKFVYLIVAGAGTSAPNSSTTIFSTSLVE